VNGGTSLLYTRVASGPAYTAGSPRASGCRPSGPRCLRGGGLGEGVSGRGDSGGASERAWRGDPGVREKEGHLQLGRGASSAGATKRGRRSQGSVNPRSFIIHSRLPVGSSSTGSNFLRKLRCWMHGSPGLQHAKVVVCTIAASSTPTPGASRWTGQGGGGGGDGGYDAAGEDADEAEDGPQPRSGAWDEQWTQKHIKEPTTKQTLTLITAIPGKPYKMEMTRHLLCGDPYPFNPSHSQPTPRWVSVSEATLSVTRTEPSSSCFGTLLCGSASKARSTSEKCRKPEIS